METLVALAVFAVVSLLPLLLFIPASQTDQAARQRTLALRADETWLDRYRANQEPLSATPPHCVLTSSTVLTCTYAKGDSYATPELTALMSPFNHVITITTGAPGINVREWRVSVTTSWPQGSKTLSTTLTTRMAF